MRPVEFRGVNVIYGHNQEGVRPLPCHKAADNEGTATFCFELDPEERAQIAQEGKLWIQVWTYDRPLEPMLPLAFKPDLPGIPS